MRLLRFDLKAVGPFTGVSLDLSRGDHGLHLIHGPNEAGKSSALRALSYLLFGFPETAPDRFVHEYNQLRVGALLRHGDGAELEIVRRKAHKDALRGPDDRTVVPEAVLERFRPGLDRATFEGRFGLDHARLREAGRQVRSGQGQIGELLFAAASGLTDLRQRQDHLAARLGSLFLARGTNPRINAAIAEYEAALRELKRDQLPSEEWERHDRALRDALGQADALKQRTELVQSERNRLARIRAAVPLVAEYRTAREALERLQDVPRLPLDFARTREQALAARLEAELTVRNAQTAQAELEERIAAITVPRDVLAEAAAIEDLHVELGKYRSAQSDRPSLVSSKLSDVHQAHERLQDLGRPRDVHEAETVYLRPDEVRAIRDLGGRLAILSSAEASARGQVRKLATNLERLRTERDDLGAGLDAEPLRRLVAEARRAGDLDDTIQKTRTELNNAERALQRAFARLPDRPDSIETLAAQVPPLDETVDRFQLEAERIDRERHKLDDQREADEAALRDLESRLQALQQSSDVPSEADLAEARQRREAGWRLIRAHWREGVEPGASAAAFVADFAPGQGLDDAYAESVRRADALADRLRREADQVARKAEWAAGRELHARRLAEHMKALAALEGEAAELHARWNAVVVALDRPACAPAELRSWLRERAKVVGLYENRVEQRAALAHLEARSTGHRSAVRAALTALGEALPNDAEPLRAVLDAADDLLTRLDESARAREQLQGRITATEIDLSEARGALSDAEVELAAVRRDWAARMRRLHLEPDATPNQAAMVLDTIDKLFQSLKDARGFAARIEGIDRDARQFADKVHALALRIAPDLGDAPPDHVVNALYVRLQAARGNDHTITTLRDHRDREHQAQVRARRDHQAACAQLAELCRVAGCAEIDELADAQRRAEERDRIEADVARCEAQLLKHSGGATLAAFLDEVDRTDLDGLDAALDARDQDLAVMQDNLDAVNQTIGAERAELGRMDGSARAAEAAQRLQELGARAQRDVTEYAVLKLAQAALRRGIERYRRKHQGPIQERASRYFQLLTDGSFAGMTIEDASKGPVLLGVRPNGKTVPLEGMSEGTHDQLYLAVVLASLDAWLEHHEPVPFVVDDVLLTFDDQRALAALKALAELSRKTQVLFFTHHRHLVDLAERGLPDQVFVQHLPGRAR